MIQDNCIVIHPNDNVGVLKSDVLPNESITCGELTITSQKALKLGDKIALKAMPIGAGILKYGSHIGSLTQSVAAGEWIHVHNMKSDYVPTHLRGDFVSPSQT